MATHEFVIRAKVGEYSRVISQGCYSSPVPPQPLCYPDIWSAEEGETAGSSGVLSVGQARADYSGGTWISYGIGRTFLWFETDDIIDGSPIASAVLTLKRKASGGTDKNDNDFSLVIQRGIDLDEDGNAVVPLYPGEKSDYDKDELFGDGGSIDAEDIGAVDTYFDIILNEDGKDWIMTGEDSITKLCLRSSDDISGTAPESNIVHQITMYSASEYTLVTNRPLLTINVTVTIPVCDTKEATDIVLDYESEDIEYFYARLNGEIESTGYWLTGYGFEWKKGVSGDVTSMTTGSSAGGKLTFEFDDDLYDLTAGTYYFRAWAENEAGKSYGSWLSFSVGTELQTISAERSSVYANTKLTGEITDGGNGLTKRGFEYIIQDSEPAEEDEGTEVLEDEEVEGEGFDNEEYEIHTGDDLRTLYNLDNGNEDWEATTIWWFRAIGYDNSDTKYYGEWVKNVPTVETGAMDNQLALNSIPMVNAHGEVTSKGANDVTERGFRIIKEYQGDLQSASYYIAIGFGDFSVMMEMESHTVLGGGDGYTVIDYYWTGEFYRDSTEEGDFDLEEFERTLGGGILGEGLGIYLKPNDTYLIQAMAKNDLGWGYGEQISVTTLAGTSISIDDDKIDSNKFEKTVTLGTVPTGCEVTRVGIRLGRTKSCNEFHYFQDGSWGTGESVTFMVELEPDSTYYIMPYIVIDYGDYEEEVLGMMDYTDPDMEDDYLSNYPVEVTDDIEEDEEKTTNAQAGQGNYSYRLINKEITCEKIGHQGLIDYYGRRRAYTVNNHLIQTKDVCIVIISDYLDKFQRLKLKVAIDIDMPIPFEEQDVVLLGDGKTLFKADTQGTVLFKADGEGELEQQPFILAKIRKIGATYTSGGSTIIPIELEV